MLRRPAFCDATDALDYCATAYRAIMTTEAAMAIPDYETMMLPILRFLSDGQEHKTGDVVSHIADNYDLSSEDIRALIPSGRAKLLSNRVGWSCTYLRKAGLISSPQRGVNTITQDGKGALSQNPEKVDATFLSQYEKFQQFQLDNKAAAKENKQFPQSLNERTPEEIIGVQSEIINNSLQNDVLEQVISMDPEAFEQLVVDLLLSMGYGGTAEDAGRAIGQSHDGGVDGAIMEDVLGLDTIYVQAKRWKNTVAIKEIRDFAGALLSKRSNKGVFITTSTFPASAREFVGSIDRKIILVDGKRLANLMIKYNLGVTTKHTVEIKEIDSDYFTT
jgi:restriction system protein